MMSHPDSYMQRIYLVQRGTSTVKLCCVDFLLKRNRLLQCPDHVPLIAGRNSPLLRRGVLNLCTT